MTCLTAQNVMFCQDHPVQLGQVNAKPKGGLLFQTMTSPQDQDVGLSTRRTTPPSANLSSSLRMIPHSGIGILWGMLSGKGTASGLSQVPHP